MPITYLKNGAPYFEDPLTYQEQRLYDKIVGDTMFNPPVGMGSPQSWGRAKARAKAEEGHKDGEEA